MIKRNNILCLSLCFVILLVFNGIGFAADAPNFGGTLRCAIIDTPPSLDQQVITSDLATSIAQHIFEGLYTFDSTYKPVPFLVKNSEVKNEGKLIVLHLREGVLFHNGKELTSEDVVASLNRWGEFGARGPVLYNNIDKVESAGKYTVNMYFKNVFAPWKNLLAFINGGPTILPKEVMDAAGGEPIKIEDYIGTGPYKFEEWQSGRFISLKRFDDYVGTNEAADGYAGERIAYFDELRFIPVNDMATRINGVKAGDYDYAERISGDFYNELDKDPNVAVVVNEGASSGMMFFNSKAGIMKDNFKLRQALEASLDMEPVLQSAIGPEGLWKLNGSISPQGTTWYSEGGIEKYSQGNIEEAKKLAKEAGYNGEQIRFMVTTSYPIHYASVVVIAQQLSEAGFNIDLQIYDWATLVSKRIKPELWDIFFTTHGFVPDPILYTFMSNAYPGWWMTEKRLDLTEKFVKSIDSEERSKIWDEIQTLLYEEVPIIKTGDAFNYDIASPELQGIGKTSLIWPKFWGTWLK